MTNFYILLESYVLRKLFVYPNLVFSSHLHPKFAFGSKWNKSRRKVPANFSEFSWLFSFFPNGTFTLSISADSLPNRIFTLYESTCAHHDESKYPILLQHILHIILSPIMHEERTANACRRQWSKNIYDVSILGVCWKKANLSGGTNTTKTQTLQSGDGA